MKAIEIGLFSFLNGTKQFVIPIYQRTYNWTKEQCQQLWNDIIRLAENPTIPGHFIGSVVYVESGVYGTAVVPQLLVIDGQQRLTTLSLLLTALGKAIEERPHDQIEITQKQLRNYYLLNNDEAGERHYKLLLTQSDKTTLMRVVNNQDLGDDAAPRIRDNYAFFVEQLRQTPNLQAVFSGLQRLIIVDIRLDRDKDNPQLIFESLNSTGLKLTQADLIRNYILMGQPHDLQTRLYNEHWYPMEQLFMNVDYVKSFNQFIRDYLTVKLGTIAKKDEVYNQFKNFAQDFISSSGNIEDLSKDIYIYARIFHKILAFIDDSPKVNDCLRNLSKMETKSYYPFIMECLFEYQEHFINHQELLETFMYTESFIFRRQLSYISIQSSGKMFSRLMKKIKLDQSNKTFTDKLLRLLNADNLPRIIPDDNEFTQRIITGYSYKSYIIERIQDYATRNNIDISNQMDEFRNTWMNKNEEYKIQLEKYRLIIDIALSIWPYPNNDRYRRDEQL